MTTRITVTFADQLAELIRTAAADDPKAKGNVSEWLARAARSRLLREAAQAEADWDRAHPAESAARMAEIETERDARWSALKAEEAEARRRGRGAA